MSLLGASCFMGSFCRGQAQQTPQYDDDHSATMSISSSDDLPVLRDNMTHVVPLYERIRILMPGDIDRLYPIISAYVQEPSLAETVTEVVIGTEHWGRGCYFSGELDRPVVETEPEAPVRDEAHLAIEKHVQGLGLDASTTEAMAEALVWEKRRIMGAWTGPENIRNDRRIKFGVAAVVLLLSLCRNVETLYVSRLSYDTPIQEYLLKANYGLLTDAAAAGGLQRLRTVEVVTGAHFPYDDEREYGRVELLEYFQYFHRLPALEAVVMEGVQEYQADRSFFVPRTGNMRTIHMSHSDVSGGMLGKILSIPKALEDFRFSIGGLWSTDGGLPLISAAELGRDLRLSRHTLRVLDLDLGIIRLGDDRWDEDDYDDKDEVEAALHQYELKRYGDEYMRMDMDISGEAPPDVDGPQGRSIVGSLHVFVAMTHLSINIGALMGPSEYQQEGSQQQQQRLIRSPPFRLVDALPPNLEYLCLYGYVRGTNPDVDQHVDDLLARMAERLPKLKELRGVSEMEPSLGDLYDENMDEEELWRRPERDFGWKEKE